MKCFPHAPRESHSLLATPLSFHDTVFRRKVEPITFRVASGKCVLVGGLAKIEVVGDCKPFLFTFFVSNEIKLHPTDSSKAEEFIAKHAGTMLTPPLEPGSERVEQIGEFESHTIDIDGAGWKEAAADITLRGLGWVMHCNNRNPCLSASSSSYPHPSISRTHAYAHSPCAPRGLVILGLIGV